MLVLKEHPKTYAALVIAIVILASVAASWLLTSPTQERINGNKVGICVHSLSADEAQLVKASGAGWIRIDVSENFSMAVNNANASGLKVLGILDSWMFDKSTVFTLDAWRENVTYYVSHFADKVDAWEIWNEPANPIYPLLNLQIPSEENMTKIVDFYYSMAQTAYPIIRQYDPNATILLFGGLHLYTGGNATLLGLDQDFASRLAAKNIAQYGDAISVHAYPWSGNVTPEVWSSYSNLLTFYGGLFQNKTLEVWVTETGQPIDSVTTEAGQANYLHDALGFFNGKVTHVFWYSLKDNTGESASFGLIGNGTTPRPAYFELQKQILK